MARVCFDLPAQTVNNILEQEQQTKFQIGQFDFEPIRVNHAATRRIQSVASRFYRTQPINRHAPTAPYPGHDLGQEDGRADRFDDDLIHTGP